MAIPCQDCPKELEDIQSWITHTSIIHGESRRDSKREYLKILNS